jgi:adenosylmethionine-8-amino-7-oxononanoate aminotransferase
MTDGNTEALIAADKRFVWHPFTDNREWCSPEHEPLVLVEGHGAVLSDSRGREYVDGHSSIWTNIHGHNQPHINEAVRWFSLKVILRRVCQSGGGSTGVGVALRIVDQYWRLRNTRRHQFIAFQNGYHGDTAGAASLGAATMFQAEPTRWNLPTIQVPTLKALESLSAPEVAKTAAVVIEPIIQGAAGMRLWPVGTLKAVREWCDHAGILLIVDEVLTGFGRTGRMFAIEHDSVIPDVMILGKGLTGGYLPLAITLVTEEVFARFDGPASEGKALAYGHSFTANALGCAAAKASLEIFDNERVLEGLKPKIDQMRSELGRLGELPAVAAVRQCGFMAGIELKEPPGGSAAKLAADVCLAARRHGLLTRPIRNVIVLMPPLCTTSDQLSKAVAAIQNAIQEVCGRLAC